LGLST